MQAGQGRQVRQDGETDRPDRQGGRKNDRPPAGKPACLPACLTCLPVSWPVRRSARPQSRPSIRPPARLPACPSVCMPACLAAWQPAHARKPTMPSRLALSARSGSTVMIHRAFRRMSARTSDGAFDRTFDRASVEATFAQNVSRCGRITTSVAESGMPAKAGRWGNAGRSRQAGHGWSRQTNQTDRAGWLAGGQTRPPAWMAVCPPACLPACLAACVWLSGCLSGAVHACEPTMPSIETAGLLRAAAGR